MVLPADRTLVSLGRRLVTTPRLSMHSMAMLAPRYEATHHHLMLPQLLYNRPRARTHVLSPGMQSLGCAHVLQVLKPLPDYEAPTYAIGGTAEVTWQMRNNHGGG